MEKVRAGSELVNQSGKALSDIMESVKKVSDIVAEIAAASEEQAQGIDQVNNAVAQMDDTTQQNAALVEEAAAAAKSMEQQAQELVAQISFFRSDKATTGTSTPAVDVKPTAVVKTLRAVAERPARIESRPASSSAAPTLRKASGDDSAWRDF